MIPIKRSDRPTFKLHLLYLLVMAVCTVLSPGWVTAQQVENTTQIKTLIDNDPWISHGGYGALTMKYGKILEQDAFFAGIRGGWLINHRFTLGIAGNGLVSNVQNDLWLPEDPEPDLEARLFTGYGGLLLEPVLLHKYPFHLAVPVVIGAGGATYGLVDTDYQGCCYYNVDFDDRGYAFFVAEPGIELEVSLTRFMRINLGASYLYTSDVNLPDVDPQLMHGFMGSFGLKFGAF